jgi:opacity protein-like surface antigen
MSMKIARLTLAAAAMMGAAGSAFAGGDVIYTGVKDYAAAVPVPAPVPLPVYEPEYYVRFDTGASWMSDGTLDEYGSSMTVRSIDDMETMEFGSIGAGRYITPSLRAEIAIDIFSSAQIDGGGDETFIEIIGPDTFSVARQETIKFEQDIGMFNLYYDFRNSTRFTPYIGGGVGVTYRQLKRTASETATCINVGCVNPPDITQSSSSAEGWDFAGALMAGLAIQVSDSVIWDTGYRYLWQSGGLSVDSPTLNGTSTVEIEDMGQHQLRTGIRLNID